LQIGIVSDYYYPQLGGITEQAHGQAGELARRGHDVTLSTPNLLVTPKTIGSGEPPSEPLFEILKVGRAYPFYVNGSETLLSISPRLVADLDRIYADRRFDVVHVHNPFGPALPIARVMRSRAPVTVGTIHSVFPEGFKLLRLFNRPLRRVCRRLDARDRRLGRRGRLDSRQTPGSELRGDPERDRHRLLLARGVAAPASARGQAQHPLRRPLRPA
jgi:phosphatidylinositol alpha-mannosyltransferase